MANNFSVVAHWNGDLDEGAICRWAENLRSSLPAPEVSMGLVFMAPKFFADAPGILEWLRMHAKIPLLVGCSSSSLIAGGQEIEEEAGLVLGLFHLPGAVLKEFHFKQEHVEECSGPGYWHMETGLTAEDTNGWLVFADPFTLDCEGWLRTWNQAYAPLPTVGGLASGPPSARDTQLYLNGATYGEGLLAVAVGGEVGLASVISQGCTPIGDTWTITRGEGNLIQEIGNRPAYEVLADTIEKLPPEEQRKLRGNLFIGLVTNEYLDDFHRGDFLIRNLLGADPKTGALAVGAFPRIGQTLQFQRRDSGAATEDLQALLARGRKRLGHAVVYGGCLCCCNGRGRRLFGIPSHDAGQVRECFGDVGLAGFFCNGEIGPVGEQSFLHGYTASLGLFVKQ